MLCIVAMCITKLQLKVNCSRLRVFRCRGLPWDHGSQVKEEWTSSSATSIGTEENSLGVLGVRCGALIYIEESRHGQRNNYKYKRHVTTE